MPKRLVIDTETTGLNEGLKLDVPVSIAVLDYDTGEVLMNTLVKSDVEIDPEASAVHGVTADVLSTVEMTLDEALHDLCVLFGEADQIEAYNAPFDMRIIQNALWLNEYRAWSLEAPKWRDVMTTYSILWGQPSKYRDGNRDVKLTAALEMQGLPLVRAHSAFGDAEMTFRLIYHMESGQVKPFKEGGFYPVNLVSMTRKRSSKNAPYASFTSVGGQTVNVFDNQFGLFHSAGHKLYDWVNDMADGETLTMEQPIAATVTFKDGWCNISVVKEKDSDDGAVTE